MADEYRLWTITGLVALFGAGTMYGVFRRMQGGFGPFNLRAVGIVATMSALLRTVGADTRTAAIGILGAVAGYLFGKDSSN